VILLSEVNCREKKTEMLSLYLPYLWNMHERRTRRLSTSTVTVLCVFNYAIDEKI